MDFRDRHPNIRFWFFDNSNFKREVCPYNGPNLTFINEFVAPLDQTVFLSLLGNGGEDENFDLSVVYYLIEAPRNCIMRQAFEIGEITFEEYWHHKGWLIEATIPSLSAQGYNLKYIHPSNMCQSAKEYLKNPSGESPVQQKHENLLYQNSLRSCPQKHKKMLEEMEKRYAGILKSA